MKAALAFVTLTLLVAGCSTPRPAFLHPQFSPRIAKISRIEVVMQSPAEIALMDYRARTQPLTNESALVSTRLPELIGAQLQQRGFVVLSNAPVVAMDADIQAQAQSWMEDWRKTGRCVIATNGESELSPEARQLAAQAQADGVVLVQCWGKTNTDARQFREDFIRSFAILGVVASAPAGQGAEVGGLLLGGTAWLVTGAGKLGEFGTAATVQVVLLDGTTGDALWAGSCRDQFIGPALDKLAAETFQTFPLPSTESPGRPVISTPRQSHR